MGCIQGRGLGGCVSRLPGFVLLGGFMGSLLVVSILGMGGV